MNACSRYKRVRRNCRENSVFKNLMASYNYPCGACKYVKRRCLPECIFAPHFSHAEGVDHFVSIHKIFGASKLTKFLSELHPSYHAATVQSILYEAQARLQNPIYGCISEILFLHQQVEMLQAQVANLQAALTTMEMQLHSTQLQPNMLPSNNIYQPENVSVDEQRNFHQHMTAEDYMQWLMED